MEERSVVPRDKPKALSQLTHRQLVGWLGFCLPHVVCILDLLLPTRGLHGLGVLDSVSAYYYSSAGSAFVGVLFALGLLLFTFPGYQGVWKDKLVGMLGGVGALGVALFPTKPPIGWHPPTWWSASFGSIHFISAFVLFSSFVLFTGWLFRLSNIEPRQARPESKQRRDAFYLACSIVIGLCMLLVPLMKSQHLPIFWPEAVAIEAFGAAWLVKGEVHRSRAARRLFKLFKVDMPPDSEALGRA